MKHERQSEKQKKKRKKNHFMVRDVANASTDVDFFAFIFR